MSTPLDRMRELAGTIAAQAEHRIKLEKKNKRLKELLINAMEFMWLELDASTEYHEKYQKLVTEINNETLGEKPE